MQSIHDLSETQLEAINASFDIIINVGVNRLHDLSPKMSETNREQMEAVNVDVTKVITKVEKTLSDGGNLGKTSIEDILKIITLAITILGIALGENDDDVVKLRKLNKEING